MSETPRRIAFDEIRKGDRIRVVTDDIAREGVADELYGDWWSTASGRWLVTDDADHDITLLDRPEPRDWPVGTTGTATVRGHQGVRVAVGSHGLWRDLVAEVGRLDESVTDFVPDLIVTDELVAEMSGYMAEEGYGTWSAQLIREFFAKKRETQR